MKIQSPGFLFTTRYEAEGNNARIYGLWERFQNDAQIARSQEYSLRFFSHGGPVTIGTRAHTRKPWDADVPIAMHSSARHTADGALSAVAAETVARAVARLEADEDEPSAPTAPSTIARVNAGENMPWPGDTWGMWGDLGVNPGPIGPYPPGPGGGGGGGGGTTHVPVIVKLFAPGIAEPVQVWELDQQLTSTTRVVIYNPQGFPTPDAPIRRVGWWRCTVTPVQDITEIYLSAESTYAVVPFHIKAISARLFRNLFRVAFEAIVPVAELNGQTLTVSVGRELSEAYGTPAVNISKPLSSHISSHAKLTSLDLTVVSARTMKEVAAQRHEPIPIDAQRGLPPDDDIAFRIQAAFSNASVSVVGFDDVVKLRGEVGEIFLHISRDFGWGTPGVMVAIDFSEVAGFALATYNAIGSLVGFSKIDHETLNNLIAKMMRTYMPQILAYVREGLARAVAQNSVADRVTFANNAMQVRYLIEPPIPPQNLEWHGDDGSLPDSTVIMARSAVGISAVPATPDSDSTPADPPAPPAEGQPGVFPPGFVVAGGPALDRLDRHKSIVFVMMENRSFDHLLGGLAASRPRPADDPGHYEGPPPNASNPSTDGFDKVPIVSTVRINMGTVTPVCPAHSYEPTGFQIRDGVHTRAQDEVQGLKLAGTMQGFTRSVAERTDSPQIVMMTYQEEQLPTYYALADDFKVCDRWFAAHPGPTWPNRYATVTGHIPALDNFEANDPRIGFLQDHSIWDTLTSCGIEWKVFESDLSLIRTFDRYRLDDHHVVRFDDLDDGFAATLKNPGPLPRVMVIEPNFTDIPPIARACDDLAPADLAHGQAFIARIYEMLRLSGRASECLFVITYDEHGGFYDHVPPPGTPLGDPALVDSFAQLHPDGPKHLGVRVPAFVISPYVSAGRVSHETFDHTAVLKTILVHNRAWIPSATLGAFGERVNKVPHLGVTLDLDQVRSWPELFANRPTRGHLPVHTVALPVGPEASGISHPTSVLVSDDGARSWEPPPPKQIRRSSDVEQPTDRGQFHSGLRDMFRPRR